MSKTIVAGSRTFQDYGVLEKALETHIITEIVCGGAKGADTLGEWYGEKNSIKVTKFPANWAKYGKSAGYIRNEEMAKYAEELIAFWDGRSGGTKHMISIARQLGLKVKIYEI